MSYAAQYETFQKEGHYGVVSLASLLRAGATFDDVLNEIDSIFGRFPSPEHEGNDFGDDKKLRRFMQENSRCVHFLVHNEREIVG